MQKFVRGLHHGRKSADPKAILRDVCGMPLTDLEKEWKEWVVKQPIDENVKLVPAAFIKTESEWSAWWQDNKGRLAWNEARKRYVVRLETSSQQGAAAIADKPRR